MIFDKDFYVRTDAAERRALELYKIVLGRVRNIYWQHRLGVLARELYIPSINVVICVSRERPGIRRPMGYSYTGRGAEASCRDRDCVRAWILEL